MGHYDTEREDWDNGTGSFKEDVPLVFEDANPKRVIAVLPSLDGIVGCGVGDTDEEAQQDYRNNLEDLITELEIQKVKLQYGLVDLEYTNVGEYSTGCL